MTLNAILSTCHKLKLSLKFLCSGFSGSFWVADLSRRFVTRPRDLAVSSVSWWMSRAESNSSMPFPDIVKNIPGTRPHLNTMAKYSISQNLTRCQWTAAYFGLWWKLWSQCTYSAIKKDPNRETIVSICELKYWNGACNGLV